MVSFHGDYSISLSFSAWKFWNSGRVLVSLNSLFFVLFTCSWLYIMLLNWQRALMAEFDLPCKAVSSAEFEVVIFHWFIVNTCQQILLFSCKHLKSHANDWYTSSYNSLNLFCLLIMQWMRFSNVLTML